MNSIRYFVGSQVSDWLGKTPLTRSGALGLTATTAAFSAKEIYESGVVTDGDYWVKGNGNTAYKVYCLMSVKGGGWTRVMRIVRDYYYAGQNFYSYAVGSSFTSDVTTTFNLPANIFGNTDGTNLSVMYRVVGNTHGGPFPGYMGGAIWRGAYLSDAFNTALDSGNLRTTTTQYSTDGISFSNHTGSPLSKANSSWNIVHSQYSTSGTVGHYDTTNQTSGFLLGHGSGLGADYAQVNYGYIENIGSVSGSSSWNYVDVYIRKDL